MSGPEAGITRDAIAVDWIWHGHPMRLVDTAGLRRKPRVEGKLEQLSVGDALRSIRFAETVILVTDALQPLERQDLTIARLVENEGRALVLALNKWDLVNEPAALPKHLRERVSVSLPQLQGVAVVPVSGADRIRPRCADESSLGRGRSVEPAGRDRRSQSLAGDGPTAPPAATRCRPAASLALYHPGEYPTAQPSPYSPRSRAISRTPIGATSSTHCAGNSICPARRSE